MWECLSRRDKTWEMRSSWLKERRGEDLRGVLMVLKSRSGNVDQRDRQRLDRTEVWAVDLMGRRERMWWRRASGRSLIRSMPLAVVVVRLSFLLRLADLVSMGVSGVVWCGWVFLFVGLGWVPVVVGVECCVCV